jgi:hypothetical protein
MVHDMAEGTTTVQGNHEAAPVNVYGFIHPASEKLLNHVGPVRLNVNESFFCEYRFSSFCGRLTPAKAVPFCDWWTVHGHILPVRHLLSSETSDNTPFQYPHIV